MIWGAVVSGITGLIERWFEKKQKKQENDALLEQKALNGEIDYDLYAMKQKQFTWLDDIIGITFTSPFIVAWFDPDRAMKWVQFVEAVPLAYWTVFMGIVASTFGLRWWFKRTQTKVMKRKSPN